MGAWNRPTIYRPAASGEEGVSERTWIDLIPRRNEWQDMKCSRGSELEKDRTP